MINPIIPVALPIPIDFNFNPFILCSINPKTCSTLALVLDFSVFLFFCSSAPIETVYSLNLYTNIDGYKKIRKHYHYYSGNDLSYFRYPDEKLLQIGNIYTKREFEIIKLIEQGFNTEQIAEKLFVSQNTVNAHRANILKKSGKTRISELIYDLMEQGLL